MGVNKIENEDHLLFECDLYADLRGKLITRLNAQTKTLNKTSLEHNFMKILSPFTVQNIIDSPTDQYNNHHKLLTNYDRKAISPEIEQAIKHRSYIINCLCTFIFHSLEKRQKYMKNVRELERKHNTIVIHFNLGQNP